MGKVARIKKAPKAMMIVAFSPGLKGEIRNDLRLLGPTTFEYIIDSTKKSEARGQTRLGKRFIFYSKTYITRNTLNSNTLVNSKCIPLFTKQLLK